jgi:hypothetical protein
MNRAGFFCVLPITGRRFPVHSTHPLPEFEFLLFGCSEGMHAWEGTSRLGQSWLYVRVVCSEPRANVCTELYTKQCSIASIG